MKISEILAQKPASIVSVPPETDITSVIKLLTEKRIGAVLVLNPDDEMIGILSERDIVRNLARHAGGIFGMTAAQLMMRNPKVATSNESIAHAMEVMTEGKFRHLPIVENKKVIGMVSIGDAVKARIIQQTHEVDRLRAYVGGAHA